MCFFCIIFKLFPFFVVNNSIFFVFNEITIDDRKTKMERRRLISFCSRGQLFIYSTSAHGSGRANPLAMHFIFNVFWCREQNVLPWVGFIEKLFRGFSVLRLAFYTLIVRFVLTARTAEHTLYRIEFGFLTFIITWISKKGDQPMNTVAATVVAVAAAVITASKNI